MALRLPATLNRIAWALKKRLAGARKRRHIVFRHNGRELSPDPGVALLTSVQALESLRGLEALADPALIAEELRHGASLAAISVNGRVACYALNAPAADWYVPLGPQDQVIYSVVTARAMMGRGLAARVTRAIAHDVRQRGGAAWLDCVLWNTRAHRAFEKAGFERIGSATYPAIVNSAAP